MMDNSKLYYTLEFGYSYDRISKLMKNFVENEFLEARDEVIKILNPMYEKWNAEYDKDVTGEDDMEYNAFIQNKHNEIFDAFNRKRNRLVKLWSDEYADICGRFNYFGKVITMHVEMRLINEKEWREYHSQNKGA